MDQVLVGPGVGLDPNQPSGGGYHQLYRAMPVQGTAHRLTHLGPTPPGPPAPVIYQGRTQAGELTNVPDTKGFEAPAPVQGRAGASGMAGRQRHTFTERPTNRSETSYRSDALEIAPPKHFIQGDYASEGDFTRTGNQLEGALPLNHGGAQQGLGNTGYLKAPTDLRKAENRGKEDRPGNAGRMNVLADPSTRSGAITQARLQYEEKDMTPHGDGSRFRQRPDIGMVDLNPLKGQQNPLDPTIQGPMVASQLKNNPFNHSLN